jgi:hypothetical protein
LTEAELKRIVARLARGGNMPACRFYFETWIRPAGGESRPVDSEAASILARMDEVAAKRRQRAGG